MAEAYTIRTGVDRLMNLISQKKKISIKQAAAELSVPEVVIEEWVDFLHEKGVIDVEYSLTTPYLVKKELTKEEAVTKEKEFHGRREAFMRKVESSLNLIERETAGLKSIKDEFRKLGTEVELDVKKVREDLGTLEKYEKLKMGLDREILSQQQGLKNEMDKVEKQILEKQAEYKDIIKHIQKEELMLDEEIKKATLMSENERILKGRLKKIEEAIRSMERESQEEEGNIYLSAQKLSHMKRAAEKIRSVIEARGNELQPLLEKSRGIEKNILETQQQILDKVTKKRGEIKASVEETKRIKEKFERFFQSKVDVDVVMDRVNTDLEKLKSELHSLIEEARVLHITSKSKKVKEYADELEKKFKRIEQKRSLFESQIINLGKLLSRNYKKGKRG